MAVDEPSTTPAGVPQLVPGDKWIRGLLDGRTIVDSRRYLFVWELPYWPWWFFPRDHVAAELMAAAAPDRGPALPAGAVRYDLVVGDRVLAGAARGYPDDPELADYVTIDFKALDHWFEEDVEVFVHPRSPYTRVDALASSRHVVVSLDGVELANSRKPTVLFETGAPARFYLPMTDVNLELLTRSRRRASCPYKGDADFYSARVGDRTVDDIAWTYVLPRPEVTPIAGLICFYNEIVDIDIDGERQPRPTSHFA
ncbi:MAG: DUF427 domain-containing protein [Actinomycetota bacterium]